MPAMTPFADLCDPHTTDLMHRLAAEGPCPLRRLDVVDASAAQRLIRWKLAVIENGCLALTENSARGLRRRLNQWLPGVLCPEAGDHRAAS